MSVALIGWSVFGLLLAGYFGQKYLPPPKPRVVGIDLGTTYSCLGVYEAVTGNLYMIRDPQTGSNTIPSIVAFRDDRVFIGDDAVRESRENPANTIYDAKRFIGRKLNADRLNEITPDYPFQITLKNGEARFVISSGKRPKYLSPEYIGALIINHLKEAAEANLSVPIKMAVMAVPADFGEDQRTRTSNAAKLAGIDVLRIINEPTAAALAYGLHEKSKIENVIVLDVGGGTSDVAVLRVQNAMFFTQALAGNNHLGGQDFTHRLYNHLLEKLNQHDSYSQFVNPQNLHNLKLAAEAAKLNLTHETSTEVILRLSSEHGASDVVFRHVVTREQFEELNSDLFNKVTELLTAALQDIQLDPQLVEEVVLVGGSTRIPKIRDLVTKYFNGRPPNTKLDPELAVGYGVAIQAGILGGAWPLKVAAVDVPAYKLKKIVLT